MRRARSTAVTLVGAALTVVLSVGPAACGTDTSARQTTTSATASNQSLSPTGESSVRPSSSPGQTSPTAASGNIQEGQMRIKITIGEQTFQGTLDDSAASRDLLALMPLTVKLDDHGSVEKTGPLPSPLSLDGQPAGADPDVGDIGYYAPGNDFVLYYGDQSYYNGIVVLGHMNGDAADQIADLDGSVTATVEAVDR